MLSKILAIFLVSSVFLINGCTTSSQKHLDNVRNQRDQAEDRITVGKVQRSIRLGMSNAEVIETLGSPNIVSTDDQRREVWVYDKISTETVYATSSSSGGIAALILGGIGGVGFGVSGQKSTGAKSSTQRTLTIIIKFNNLGKVRDIAYHSSQF